MDLKTYLTPIFKWWWLIVAAVILAVGTSFYFVRLQPPVYAAHTTLMIGRTITDPNPSGNDFFLNQQLASLYANMASTEPITNATMKVLGLKDLPKFVVKPLANNQFIEIDVTDTDPQRAMLVAKVLADQLIAVSPGGSDANDTAHQDFIKKQIDNVQKQILETENQIVKSQLALGNLKSARDIVQAQTDLQALQTKLSLLQTNYASLVSATRSSVANILQIIEPASVPVTPIGPGKGLIVAIAGLISLVLSGGAAYLLESLDDSIRTPTEVQKFFGLPTIGYFLDIGKRLESKTYVYDHPHSQIAEAYRSFRANLEFSKSEAPLNVLLISSMNAQDGKTSVAINLALSLVQGGKRVILVDADLRRPSVHAYLELPDQEGLRTVLKDMSKLPGALQRWKDTNLMVLTAGGATNELPDQLLAPASIETFLYDLRNLADVVIIDSSPMLVADAMVLASKADGVIFVVRPGQTHRDMFRTELDKIVRAGANVVGVVFNRIPKREVGFMGDYRMYTPYYSSTYGNDLETKAAPNKEGKSFVTKKDIPSSRETLRS